MKITIGSKLLITFTLITSLISLVSLIGITGLNSMGKEYSGIVETNMPVENLVNESSALTLEQVAAVRGYIIYKEESYVSLYADLNKEIDLNYQEIDSKLTTQESRDFLKHLKVEHTAYDQGAQQVLDLVSQGKMEDAIKLAGEIKSHVTNIKEITANWSNWVKSVNEGIKSSIELNMKNRLILISFLVVLSLSGSLLIGLYLTRTIAKPIKLISKLAGKISDGDLTQAVPKIKSHDELFDLGEAFKLMINNLHDLITNVNDASQELVASSEELAASSEEVTKQSEQTAFTVSDLAKGSTDQAESSEKGNIRIKQMIEGLDGIVKEMINSEEMGQNANKVVENGQKSVKYQESKVIENTQMSGQVSLAILQLSEKSDEINQILEVIRSIATQTNLLALNAAIEAARAGDAGRGFSVVADEIRKLAEQSAFSAEQIGKIIKEVQTSIDGVVTLTEQSKMLVSEQTLALNETINAFDKISTVVVDITQNVRQVTAASKILGISATEVGYSISEIASVAEETAACTQELSASLQEQTATVYQVSMAADDLSKLASTLHANVMKFKV